MAGFSGGARADIPDNNEDWSGDDEEWMDELSLSTMKEVWENEKDQEITGQNSDSSNTDTETSDDETPRPAPRGKPANKKSTTEQTTSREEIRRWISYPENFPKTPKLPDFDATGTGITGEVDLDKTKTPLDFFKLFFSMSFLTSIVDATNSYAQQTRYGNPEKNQGKWTPVTVNCLAKFLGLTLLMGLIKKPTIKDYWSTASELATPFFKFVMSRDRFISILRYINFPADPTDYTPNKAMHRVNTMFRRFNAIARTIYKPRKNISIDESMVAHKGRTPHTQYMPAKPTRWGLKVWVLAESVSGYVIQALPYFRSPGGTGFRIYEDVVLRLLQSAKILGKMYHLYCDNYYTSVPMLEELCEKYKTFCCGTLRKNRKHLPKKLMQKKIPELKEKGQSKFSKSRNLILCIWRDRKLIHLLSTIHGTQVASTKRTVKGQDGKFVKKDIPCPTCVKDYCSYMGGVDLSDQLMNYYSFSRKTHKWTKKMFWFMLEVMKVNAAVMFNSTQEKSMPLYDFTLQILQPLFSECSSNENIPKAISGLRPNRLTNRCLPMDLGRKSFCKVCYARFVEYENKIEKNNAQPSDEYKRRQTRYGCGPCSAHLCMPTCFSIYHSIDNFGALPKSVKKVSTEE